MADLPRVILYGRPDCHLCDDARAVIERARRERHFALDEVDVSADAALERDYGERVPVVAVGGEEVFEYFVDPVRLLELVALADEGATGQTGPGGGSGDAR